MMKVCGENADYGFTELRQGRCGPYKLCVDGLQKVTEDLGPIDILVNNAGIIYKMTPEQWYEVINTNLNSLFNMTRPVIEGSYHWNLVTEGVRRQRLELSV